MTPPCATKRAYLTRHAARRYAKQYAMKFGGKRQRAYHCPHCTCWHLTSENERVLRAAQRGNAERLNKGMNDEIGK